MVNHGANTNTSNTDTRTVLYDTSRGQNDTVNITDLLDQTGSCYPEQPEDESADSVTGDFDWDKQTQGLLLGAVFWGYMSLQAPTGWLTEKFGAQRIILVCFTIASISCLCTPVAAHAHPYILLAVRIVTGMGIAVFYPSLAVFWSRWAPPGEWGRLLSFCLSGGLLGNAVIFPFGGFMCGSGFSGGWPSLYYVLGATGLAWCLLWGLVVRDSPGSTPWLSDKERLYIEETTRPRRLNTRRSPIPWRRMMTSRATISLVTTHSLINYGTYMLITQLPTYMKEVMKLNIGSNGVFSMLPYLMFFIMVLVAGWLSDLLITRVRISVCATRKLLTALGCLLPAVCLLILALVQCIPHSVAITLLCGAVGLVGFTFGGFVLNYADIALQFAGTLSGIGNCISTVPGIVAPYIVAVITVNGTRQEWQYAFLTGVAGYVLAAVIFLCFASGEVQTGHNHDSVSRNYRKFVTEVERKTDFKCMNCSCQHRMITNALCYQNSQTDFAGRRH